MTKTLTISAIITSVILLSGTLGFVLSIPDASAGIPPLSEECQECDEELDEEMLEIDEEERECKEDAGTDAEEVAECVAEAEDDRDEANEEWEECVADNACMMTT